MTDHSSFQGSLALRDLSVARGGRIILAGVNISVGPGEAVILRGPNGSGKTTLLRAAAGLLAPASGAVEVTSARDDEARVFCSALNAIKAAMSVDENLRFWASLYGAASIDEARAAFGLDRFSERAAGHLSTGYQRRLGLARLLIARRPIWLIDEPTATLDRQAAENFETILARHRAAGGAAIIATHEPLEAEGARVMEIAA